MPEPFEDLSATEVGDYLYVAAEDALDMFEEYPELYIQVGIFTERQLSNFWEQVYHQIYLRKETDDVQEMQRICTEYAKRISVKYIDILHYRRTPKKFYPGRIFTSQKPYTDSEPHDC